MELPDREDREYFTVQELADRWGCSQYDVFEYVKSGKIAPSFKFEYPMCLTETLDEQESRLHYYVENGSHDGYKAEWKTWENGIKTIDRSDPDSFVLCNSRTYSGIYTLSVDQVMQWWGDAQLSESWEGNLQGMFFPLPDYDGKQFRIIPVYPFKVTTADFLFLLGEVERFEAECCQEPAAVKSTAAPKSAHITDTKPQAASKSPGNNGFGGPVRKGRAYTPEGRFMDRLLSEYRTQCEQESEDFQLLVTFISPGMESKDDKYKVIAIDKDSVTLRIKRRNSTISMKDLKKLWEHRKSKNPFKAQ